MHKTRLVCLSLGLFFVSSLFLSTPIQAGVGVKPASLSFGSVTVNTPSSAATVVVTNNGGQAVSILQVSSSLPEFIVISPAMPITLSPHGSASFQVVFQPDAAKTFSGSIVFSTSRVNGGGTQSISVSGTGTTASSVSSTSSQSYLLSASASSLNFGNTLVGGWKLNVMLTLQTGPMLATWGNVIYLGGPLNLQQRQPDGVTFDTTRFNTASSQQLSGNIRTFDTQFGNLRRDVTKNVDMSMSKNFAFAEKKYLQVRIETFNTTNRATFGAPSLSPTSTAFGTISTQARKPNTDQKPGRCSGLVCACSLSTHSASIRIQESYMPNVMSKMMLLGMSLGWWAITLPAPAFRPMSGLRVDVRPSSFAPRPIA